MKMMTLIIIKCRDQLASHSSTRGIKLMTNKLSITIFNLRILKTITTIQEITKITSIWEGQINLTEHHSLMNHLTVVILNLSFPQLKEVNIQILILKTIENPNQKYVETHKFLNGEGTSEDNKQKVGTNQVMDLKRELEMQIEEKRKKREEEKRKLKEDELREEERVNREIAELNRRE